MVQFVDKTIGPPTERLFGEDVTIIQEALGEIDLIHDAIERLGAIAFASEKLEEGFVEGERFVVVKNVFYKEFGRDVSLL